MADFWSFTIVVCLLWHVIVPSRYIWREGTWHTPGNQPRFFRFEVVAHNPQALSLQISGDRGGTCYFSLSIATPYIIVRPSLTSFSRYCTLRNFGATWRNIPRPPVFIRISFDNNGQPSRGRASRNLRQLLLTVCVLYVTKISNNF